MVCTVGRGRMAGLARLLDAGNVSQNVTVEEVSHQKLAAQYLRRQLQEADEANLLDEEDMHIFGLKPLTDPLDLVCCNACKKPIMTSQYAAHAELCKSLSSRAELIPEHDGPAVNKKPPRKERKKLLNSRTTKPTSLGEPKKFKSVDYDDKAAPESYVDERTQMATIPERRRYAHPDATHKMNGSGVSRYNADCSKDATLHSPKPFNMTSAKSPPDPGSKNLCSTSNQVLSYAPAPLATKIYYCQRKHNLRRAIRHMFYEESSKKSSCEVSELEVPEATAVPAQTSSPSHLYHEEVNQQRADHVLHLTQTPDRVLGASPDCQMDKYVGFVPSVNMVSQLPVNNTVGPHYMSNSYSFAGKAGKTLGTVQQGSGSVPVV